MIRVLSSIRFAGKWPALTGLFYFCLFSMVGAKDKGASPNSLWEDGRFESSTGAAINYRDNRGIPDTGVGWAFLDVGYESGSWYGLSGGASFLVVPNLWQNHGNDYDDTFVRPYDLRDLYLSWYYTYEDESYFRLSGGRREFPANPSLDGMSQEGLGVSWKTGPWLSIHVGAFHRWIKYSTANYDANGITGWEDVSQANAGAGDVFFSVTANWIPNDRFQVSPYLNHQEGVMSVYGSTFTYRQPLAETRQSLAWKTEVILAYYQNRVPSMVEPDYNGVGAGRIYTGVEAEWRRRTIRPGSVFSGWARAIRTPPPVCSLYSTH